jgi:hypothetical protein
MEEEAVVLDELRERHRRQYAVDIHVVDPLLDLVASLTRFAERQRLHSILGLGTADHGA